MKNSQVSAIAVLVREMRAAAVREPATGMHNVAEETGSAIAVSLAEMVLAVRAPLVGVADLTGVALAAVVHGDRPVLAGVVAADPAAVDADANRAARHGETYEIKGIAFHGIKPDGHCCDLADMFLDCNSALAVGSRGTWVVVSVTENFQNATRWRVCVDSGSRKL